MPIQNSEKNKSAKPGGRSRRKPRVRFARIKALGVEKVALIDGLLLDPKEPDINVVKMIQQEWNAITDVSELSLLRQLKRYKDQELGKKSEVGTGRDLASNYRKKEKERAVSIVAALREKVNVVTAMNNLVLVQAERVEATLDKEKRLNMPIGGLSKDIETLADLIKDLAELEFETGIRQRMPKDIPLHLIPHANSDSFSVYREKLRAEMLANGAVKEALDFIEADFKEVPNDD